MNQYIDESSFVFQGLTSENLQHVASSIQRALHIRDEQMAWVDACCLQFTVKNKDGREKETFTFQTDNPVIKKDWIVGEYNQENVLSLHGVRYLVNSNLFGRRHVWFTCRCGKR